VSRPKHTKKDANQVEIVTMLRHLGAVVWDTADLGGKVLDLVVFWRGRIIPVEVKMPTERYRLTDGEIASIEELRVAGVEPCVATCVEDVVDAFDAILSDDLPFSDDTEEEG